MVPPLRLDEFYRVAVGLWSVQPSEFWGMTMREYWWMFDAKRPPPAKVGSSPFTKAEVARIAAEQRAAKRARQEQESSGDS